MPIWLNIFFFREVNKQIGRLINESININPRRIKESGRIKIKLWKNK